MRTLRLRAVAAFAGLMLVASVSVACSSSGGEAATVTSTHVVPPTRIVSVPSSTEPTNKTVTATTRPARVTTAAKAPAVRDPLTGGTVSAGPLIAAKIDNTSAGFPQFGVAAADIVYVEQVEGGLTRLIVLFHSKLPDEVGPIRSVRSTDAELLSMYGTPGLAFSGGAGGPLNALHATKIVDLSPVHHDQAYWRSQFGDGTHNLHVDLARLGAEVQGLGRPKSPGFTFAAKDPRLAKSPAVSSIEVTMQSGRTGFDYANGRYAVRHKGGAYVDHDGTAVHTDNVLVQHVTDEPDGTVDSVGSPSYLSHTIGSGKFTLYRDGHQISGTWKRAAATAPTSYLDDAGKPVLFKPGKTWVLLAPQGSQVSSS